MVRAMRGEGVCTKTQRSTRGEDGDRAKWIWKEFTEMAASPRSGRPCPSRMRYLAIEVMWWRTKFSYS